MSHNNYNNNSINYNYGFGSNNHSNITNYTTPQQDTVSQVVNLLNQCSIEQLEKIKGELAKIKQTKENQFRNDIYMWCCKHQKILDRINEIELGAALNCNSVLFGQQHSYLYTYMHLKRFITNVLQSGTFDYINYSYITDRKDVNVFKQKARQIVHNAQQAISYIRTQDPTNYNQHLHNGNMRAQTQKFMENDFKNWLANMMQNGLWDNGKRHNDAIYTDPEKNRQRGELCWRAEQILGCKNDIDELANALHCQQSDVIKEVQRFMQQCNDFIQKYGKHQNIANYNTNNMNYNNMIGNY